MAINHALHIWTKTLSRTTEHSLLLPESNYQCFPLKYSQKTSYILRQREYLPRKQPSSSQWWWAAVGREYETESHRVEDRMLSGRWMRRWRSWSWAWRRPRRIATPLGGKVVTCEIEARRWSNDMQSLVGTLTSYTDFIFRDLSSFCSHANN